MEPATTRNEKILGAGQILLAALLWSSAGLVIRGVSCDMFWLLVIRSGAACLVLAPGLGALRGRRFGLNAFLAALLYALFMVAFAVSTRVVGAAQAVGGQYTAPLFVYLALAVQRKLRVRLSGVLPMALIAAGCAVALVGGGLTPLTLLPLASGVLFPLYSAFLRRAGDVPAGAVMCVGNLLCVLISLPFTWGAALPRLSDAGLVALAGVLVNGFGYTVYARGTRRVDALAGVMLCLAEPVLNPVWVWLFLGEAPGGTALASLLLILAGGVLDAAFAALRTRRRA